MKAEHTLHAAVIGAGNIGAFFDTPESPHVLTHAHAYQQHPSFELVGFVDSDHEKACRAAAVWGGRAYRTLEELLALGHIDVVSVCAPTETRMQMLSQISGARLRGGIIEKPLASSIADAQTLALNPYYTDRPFLFNFKRRFLPEFRKLQEDISGGVYGDLLSGRVLYGKGLNNNGVHVLDTLRFMGINLEEIRSTLVREDPGVSDPSYEVTFGLPSGGTLHMQVIPANLYKVFEFDLLFERKRIRIGDEGFPVEEYDITEDPLFKNYYIPTLSRAHESSASRSMEYVVDNLYHSITGDTSPLCTVRDGYEAQYVGERIRQFDRTVAI